jgi:protein-tyrosine phosphatase
MIDIHCHLLPGLDDGAVDLAMSLRMARALIDDGVEAVVCTPHILPGLYHNRGEQIEGAVARLRSRLADDGLRLDLYSGADAHITIDFVAKLASKEIPTLADSRYVLIELPQHVEPRLIKQFFFQLRTAGYIPILSHPERMPWIASQYRTIEELVASGVWLQLTVGSLLGDFGRDAKYWAERILDDGIAHVIATDAHNDDSRPPNLRMGYDVAAKRIGDTEAEKLVKSRPDAILCNEAPAPWPLSSCATSSVGYRNG